VDERLAVYGWETNTGVKFVVGVDGRGREDGNGGAGRRVVKGGREREGEMKAVSLLCAFFRFFRS